MKKIVFAALMMSFANAAFANDSFRLVCSGVTTVAGENFPLSFDILDVRGRDGESRTNYVSATHQATFFVDTVTSIGDLPAGQVTLKNVMNKRTFFSGRYRVQSLGGSFSLELVGGIVIDPLRDPKLVNTVQANLPCVNLSI